MRSNTRRLEPDESPTDSKNPNGLATRHRVFVCLSRESSVHLCRAPADSDFGQGDAIVELARAVSLIALEEKGEHTVYSPPKRARK